MQRHERRHKRRHEQQRQGAVVWTAPAARAAAAARALQAPPAATGGTRVGRYVGRGAAVDGAVSPRADCASSLRAVALHGADALLSHPHSLRASSLLHVSCVVHGHGPTHPAYVTRAQSCPGLPRPHGQETTRLDNFLLNLPDSLRASSLHRNTSCPR